MTAGVFLTAIIAHDMNLSWVGHGEGTLNIGGQVFQSSYEECDAKQFFQEFRWKLSLQLAQGVHGVRIQRTTRLQKPDQRRKWPNK